MDMDDRQLRDRIARGGESAREAFEALYKHHAPDVQRFLARALVIEQQFVCNSAHARGGGREVSRLVHAEVDFSSLPLLGDLDQDGRDESE